MLVLFIHILIKSRSQGYNTWIYSMQYSWGLVKHLFMTWLWEGLIEGGGLEFIDPQGIYTDENECTKCRATSLDTRIRKSQATDQWEMRLNLFQILTSKPVDPD